MKNSNEIEFAAQRDLIMRRMTGGCLECGASTEGKYCETHARLNFEPGPVEYHVNDIPCVRYG